MFERLFVAAALFSALLSGCYEKKCGPNQRLEHNDYCVCIEGTMTNEELDCVPTKTTMNDGGSSGGGSSGDTSSADASMMQSSGGCDKSTGLGCSCKSDADCASYPADYCIIPDPSDPEMKRACMLQGCDEPGKECPSGMSCCKFPFAPKKTVCLPTEIMCPFG